MPRDTASASLLEAAEVHADRAAEAVQVMVLGAPRFGSGKLADSVVGLCGCLKELYGPERSDARHRLLARVAAALGEVDPLDDGFPARRAGGGASKPVLPFPTPAEAATAYEADILGRSAPEPIGFGPLLGRVVVEDRRRDFAPRPEVSFPFERSAPSDDYGPIAANPTRLRERGA